MGWEKVGWGEVGGMGEGGMGGGWDGRRWDGRWVGWGEVGGFRHEVLCTLYHGSCCSWPMKGFQLALEGEGRGIFSSPLHKLV